MICYHGALSGTSRSAVALCHDCGAALCPDHIIPGQHTLFVVRATNHYAPVEPPERRIWCQTCATAIDAANNLSAARRADQTMTVAERTDR